MTLLSIVQDVASEVGLPEPTAVIGNTDQAVKTILRMVNKEGKILARRHSWHAITKEKTHTSLAQESQTGMYADDLDRFINESMFNRTRKRRVAGPLSSQEWQVQKSIVASVLTDAFRVRAGAILLTPVPSAGDTYAYEYVSKYWCTTTGGTTPTKERFTVDTDIALLDEELITLGVIWRFLKAKGFDYGESFMDYEGQVEQAIFRDGSKRTINMAHENLNDPRPPTVQEGSWSL